MEKSNAELRKYMSKKGLHHYEVAHMLGVDCSTFCRWLRFELSEDKKRVIFEAIDKLS